MSTDITEEKRGISRRDLIKKGAVAGAVVWTVPFIESVPAYAATSSNITTTCSWFVLVYEVGGVVYADRITSTGACAGNTTSNDVVWCYQCPGTSNTYDNWGSNGGGPPYNPNNAVRLNGAILTGSGCTDASGSKPYFTVSGTTITANSGVSILFAVASAGSLDGSTGTDPGTLTSAAPGTSVCNNSATQDKVNVFCGPITSASANCLP